MLTVWKSLRSILLEALWKPSGYRVSSEIGKLIGKNESDCVVMILFINIMQD